MAVILCKTIPRTTQDVHLKHATRLYFPFGLLQDLFLHLFPNANIEITKTLALLFILLHLNVNATKRLGRFALLLGV